MLESPQVYESEEKLACAINQAINLNNLSVMELRDNDFVKATESA